MKWTIARIQRMCRSLWRGQGSYYIPRTPAQQRAGRAERTPDNFSPHQWSNSGLIDTEQALSKVLDTLEDLPTNPPSLYVDLEGIELSWSGAISILQLLVLPTNQTHLVDVFTLKKRAFTASSSYGHTLKDILESPSIPKVFFDVRQDSSALYGQFGVSLRKVHDLQLMELALRYYRGKYVNGLARCIENDAGLTSAELDAWKSSKQRGLKLFVPELGGAYKVLNDRPLSDEILNYCVEDVRFLPRLWKNYDKRMAINFKNSSIMSKQRVETATMDRIRSTQTPTHDPSRNATLAPDGWYKVNPKGDDERRTESIKYDQRITESLKNFGDR